MDDLKNKDVFNVDERPLRAQDVPGAASQPLSFETVFEKAIHADYWLVKYNQVMDMTYQELRQEYAPYENFDAYQERRVYGCNTGRVPYYEEFPLHPDYLLSDLIQILHPELGGLGGLRYFCKLNED